MENIEDAWKEVTDYYNWTQTFIDPRTKGWFLVDSIVPVFWISVFYFLTVWLGPKVMKNRKAFKLKWILIPYNLATAILNGYIVWQLSTASIRLRYNIFCEPSRQVWTPDELQIIGAIWWYYFSKLLEYGDTFFFILRKKDNQLSFLHIYHHSTMFMFWWIVIKWVPSGSTIFFALVNSTVHVLMYSYYGLSAFGPQMSKYLWWKKYLTVIQLLQFSGALGFSINGVRIECDFPRWMAYAVCAYMVSFLILFGRFYIKSYIDDKRKKKQQKSDTIMTNHNNIIIGATQKDKEIVV